MKNLNIKNSSTKTLTSKPEKSSKPNTKNDIANSFKSLMKIKPISKITVTDIIKDCNINRNTFYYHFTDIIDLFKWIHDEDALSYVRSLDLLENSNEAIQFAYDYIIKNKNYLNSAYHAFGSIGTKRIFYDNFMSLTKDLVDTAETHLNLSVTDEYKEFVYIFYTEAIFGLILHAIQQTEDFDSPQLSEYIRTIFSSSIPQVLLNGPTK